jgi:hypothetical protein
MISRIKLHFRKDVHGFTSNVQGIKEYNQKLESASRPIISPRHNRVRKMNNFEREEGYLEKNNEV